MTDRVPIEDQISILERMIKELWGVLTSEEKKQAIGARTFLIWAKDNADMLRLAAKLAKDPAVSLTVEAVAEAFPGSKVRIADTSIPTSEEKAYVDD
jgi:hypothetical protein